MLGHVRSFVRFVFTLGDRRCIHASTLALFDGPLVLDSSVTVVWAALPAAASQASSRWAA